MEIAEQIEAFCADIYFKMPEELNNDYVKICEKVAAFFEENYASNNDVLNQSAVLLEHLLLVMKANDYIKMADELYYTVKPIFDDINFEA